MSSKAIPWWIKILIHIAIKLLERYLDSDSHAKVSNVIKTSIR